MSSNIRKETIISGPSAAFDDLNDVDMVTTPPVVTNILEYDGSDWVPGAAPAGSSADDVSVNSSAATDADFNAPFGLAMDAAGNLFISDRVTQRIRRVDAISGIVTTVAGTIASSRNQNIRVRVSPGRKSVFKVWFIAIAIVAGAEGKRTLPPSGRGSPLAVLSGVDGRD